MWNGVTPLFTPWLNFLIQGIKGHREVIPEQEGGEIQEDDEFNIEDNIEKEEEEGKEEDELMNPRKWSGVGWTVDIGQLDWRKGRTEAGVLKCEGK